MWNEFKGKFCGVFQLRLFDLDDDVVQLAQEQYELRLRDSRKLTVDSALIIDGVKLFYKTLEDHYDSPQLRNVNPLHCDETDNWDFGYTLINYMKTVSRYLCGKVLKKSI